MDYEKKYKEMKARVLEIGQGYVKGVDFSKPRQIAEYIDPELKESEDANIRGAIIDYLKDNNLTEWAAWLEKQGEPKSTSWKPTKEQYGALDYAFNCCPDTELGNYFEGVLSNLIDELHKLEKQDEQKPITDFSNLRTWKYIVDAVLTEKEGIGQYLDSPFTEEVAKKLQKRFGNIEQMPIEWSEEDEAMYQGIIETEQYMLDVVYGRKNFSVGNESIKEECAKELVWLKSLKDRIK